MPKPIDRQGLGTIKSWAIDGWLPEAGAAGRMKNAELALSDTSFDTGSLAYLKWLDDGGKGPTGAASYDSWAAKNPANRDFLTQGADRHWHISDLGRFYLDKDTSGGRKAWLDFVKVRQGGRGAVVGGPEDLPPLRTGNEGTPKLSRSMTVATAARR